MKAIDLFKNMNFELIRNDDDYVIYSKVLEDNVKLEVSFSDQLQGFTVSFKDTPSRQYPNIYMELFEAIQKQLFELGWVKK